MTGPFLWGCVSNLSADRYKLSLFDKYFDICLINMLNAERLPSHAEAGQENDEGDPEMRHVVTLLLSSRVCVMSLLL